MSSREAPRQQPKRRRKKNEVYLVERFMVAQIAFLGRQDMCKHDIIHLDRAMNR